MSIPGSNDVSVKACGRLSRPRSVGSEEVLRGTLFRSVLGARGALRAPPPRSSSVCKAIYSNEKPRLEADPAGFLVEGVPLKTARWERTCDILMIYFGRVTPEWLFSI
jgi:hypothetical protein